MGKKKVKYNEKSLNQLPNNQPVLYRIKTRSGTTNYAGVAKRGRVKQRIAEHIGEIPGSTVEIEQFTSIRNAEKKETNVIKRSKPKYNIEGK
jgi:excinuclease UvrABC nuclease subunit